MRPSLPLLLLLLAASVARAALPAALDALLRDLEGRSTRYTAGEVSYDGELAGKLDDLKAQLEAIAAALPASDRRRSRLLELAGETLELRQRSVRDGRRYGQIGRELAAHAAAVRALDRQAAAPGGPQVLPRGAGPQLAQRGTGALLLLDQGRRSEPFSFLRDGVASPAAPLARPLGPQPSYSPLTRAEVVIPYARPVPPPPLARGAENPTVTALQNDLNVVRRAVGLRVIGVDGDYGPQTEAAVRKFQEDNDLPPTGQVDALTAAAIARWAGVYRAEVAGCVQIGDENDEVRAVQDMLNRIAGNRIIADDGDFGGRTQTALRAFQRANRLAPHGHVDRATLAALRAAAEGKPPVGRFIGGRALTQPGPAPETWDSRRMPADVAALVAAAEAEFGIRRFLFRSIVWAEGGVLGNSSRARGPAQVTWSAWNAQCKDLGAWERVSVRGAPNVRCGARIYASRGAMIGPDYDPLIAASLYNTKQKHWAGIIRANKVPNFPETTAYVTRISRIYCEVTGVRLLDPHRHLDPSKMNHARSVDREMDVELALEGRAPRPGCSPF
ncbi:MAG: peptidoglycan-binding protein [Elusimicrobiota bacterium]|nr:peptidoglycan-binding protein [Elusimicrobiota bacterium]